MRFAGNGDTLWTRTLGNPQLSEVAYSIDTTADGGFILAGYKVQSGGQYDLHVMKTNANGQLLWQRSYGSPWSDNTGFATVLRNGRIALAGGERASSGTNKRPVLYLLEANGDEVWSAPDPDPPEFGVYFAKPIEMDNGDLVVSGAQTLNGVQVGMLSRLDSTGTLLWKRYYQTTDLPNYTYDVRRTLDGGFIMAGTAFDSALVSQDAWLVKVDSFGCLVPGCQVFDGVQEQVTDLRDALRLWPNPVHAQGQLHVAIDLPAGFALRGPLRLALTDAAGRLVQEHALPDGVSAFSFPVSSLPSGLYHVHLLDATRWLSGGKVVVSPP
ncbi:MAG: PQQ-like beta-propeller repeat protein [Flavobacteriales bacterium]|nr:PQQ-like beta-propeller repeat protein [Flavobacteriales bacterium]